MNAPLPLTTIPDTPVSKNWIVVSRRKPSLSFDEIQKLVQEHDPISIEISWESTERKTIREHLWAHIVGQKQAIETVADVLDYGFNNVLHQKWPLGVLLFAGPTGVGKTEIAKSLSQLFFWDENAMIRVNCEELQDSFWISKLIGAWDGYVGFGKQKSFHRVGKDYKKAKDSGALHAILRGHETEGLTIFLFDEIEKAHPDVVQALLWVFEEGKIKVTTNKSTKGDTNKYIDEEVDLSNTLFILTSNLGQRDIQNMKERPPMGFWNPTELSKKRDAETLFDQAFKSHFSPEFRGRISNVVQFEDIEEGHCREMIIRNIEHTNNFLRRYFVQGNIHLWVSDTVIDSIIEKGFTKAEWARPLLRTLKQEIYRPLGRVIKSDEFEAYKKTRNPAIIYFDIQNESILPSIINPQMVEEIPEIDLGNLDDDYREPTVDLVRDILDLTCEYSRLMTLLWEQYGFSEADIDILSELDHQVIQNHVFAAENFSDISMGKGKDHTTSVNFYKDIQNLFADLPARAIKKLIDSYTQRLIKDNPNLGKEILILGVILHTIKFVQAHFWVDRLAAEQNDKLILLACASIEKYWH